MLCNRDIFNSFIFLRVHALDSVKNIAIISPYKYQLRHYLKPLDIKHVGSV